MIKSINSSRVVVVPCFNEAKRIAASNFVPLVSELKCKIIFVDDGSVDGTGDIIRGLPLESDSYSIIRLPRNLGKAAAIMAGIKLALERDFLFIGLFDADGAIHFEDLRLAFDLIEKSPSVSVVSGARILLAGNDVIRKTQRRWIGRVVATLVALIIQIQVYDPQSPCKVYRASDLRRIYRLQINTKWFVDAELLSQLKSIQTPGTKWLIEFPVTNWKDVDGSSLSLLSFFKILDDLRRLRRG